jgi:hypothetical protein
MKQRATCAICGPRPDQGRGRHHHTRLCRPAGVDIRWQLRAGSAVYRAIQRGELTNLKKKRVRCTDCTARAVEYDHRDYAKPLEVQPVCRSCNLKRGTAAYPNYPAPRAGNSKAR